MEPITQVKTKAVDRTILCDLTKKIYNVKLVENYPLSSEFFTQVYMWDKMVTVYRTPAGIYYALKKYFKL